MRSFVVVAAAVFCSCAPLTVQQQAPASLAGVADVSFLGAYDARVMMGGVQTMKEVRTVGAMPVYGSGGYAGTIYYPKTEVHRTGEIAPNDALRLVAEGFAASVNGGRIQDLSATTPLEARSEMGMDWFARNNPELSNHLVSVEVKSASVYLDDAQSNWRLGIAAVTLGVLAPCLLCTTAPCLAYPAVAVTRARSEATGTLRVYDRRGGRVVHRAELSVGGDVELKGFHDPEELFRLLSDETGKRLGYDAAQKLSAWLNPQQKKQQEAPAPSSAPPPAPASTWTPDDEDPNPAPVVAPKATPSLDRPAGAAPPPPGSR